MSSEATLQPAYVLHARAYRETSIIVDLFTRDFGRLSAVAKGVRRAGSAERVLLQPFRPLLISWRGRGSMPTLRGVEANGPIWQLNGAALASAFYINELLVRLVPAFDPHPDMLGPYERVLAGLAEAPVESNSGLPAIEIHLRCFEKRLLEELGYGLILDHEGPSGAALADEGCYTYHLDQGPIAQAEQGRQSGVQMHGDAFKALHAETFSSVRQLQEAKQLMRLVINAHLGGKPLHSRELMKKKVL
ncbi:MAG: DNA repair protein RecO [Pseudomonadota bacterium]